MNSIGPAIELRGLTKQYGKTTAVDAIDLTVPSGTTLGLLGPNGAGKSTTLRMMMGVLRPTSGDLRVLDMDVMRSPAEVKQRVGYVPEAHYIYRWMSVDAVLQFARACYRTWNADLCSELLDMFELPHQKLVRQLSKGMLAKLSLVVALARFAVVGRTIVGSGPDCARRVPRRRVERHLRRPADGDVLQPPT